MSGNQQVSSAARPSVFGPPAIDCDVHIAVPSINTILPYLEDYVAQAFAFEAGLVSLVAEGVFARFPGLKVVLTESGVSWLPACAWRFDKTWRGVRAETPWVKRPLSEIARDHVRLTLQPFDGPDGGNLLEQVVEQLGSDRMILFSTDFPHWHYEGTDALPLNPQTALGRRILAENALETYPRLSEPTAAS